jgi:peptidoglycan/LPS O-acetylase OafA/YrhL
MRAIVWLIVLAMVAVIGGRRLVTFSREKFAQMLPKAASQLLLKLRQEVAMGKTRSRQPGQSREQEERDDCLDALMEMVSDPTKGMLLNMFMYSFKGLNDIGDYKGCTNQTEMRYILLLIKISDGTPSSANFGICGPKKCTADVYEYYLKDALLEMVHQLMGQEDLPENGNFFVTNESVRFVDIIEKNEELGRLDPLTVIILVLGVGLVLACIISTYIDYRTTKGEFKGKSISPVVESFSLVRNSRFLFYQKNPVDINLETWNGVRVLSMCWVICGHTFDYFSVSPLSNLLDIPDKIENSYGLQFLAAGTYSIDVFFCMSGFLCALTMTAQFAQLKGAAISAKAVFVSYAHRYIRLLPLYLLAMLSTITVIPYFFTGGPLSVFNEWQMNCCKEKWWHNLLYIQNFTKIGEGCLIWGWYLANDMQFFLITPLLIILYNHSSKWALRVIGAIMVMSIGAQIFVLSYYDLSTSYFYKAKGELFEDYYVKPYDRVNAYVLGIMVAWAFMTWKTDQKRGADSTITRWTRRWVDNVVLKYILIAVGIGITFGLCSMHYVFNHYWQDIVTWHNVVFIAVSRPLFVVGLLMVVYPVILGREKTLFAILGAPFWNVLGKLTYGAYLFHVLITIAEKSGEYHAGYWTIMRTFFFSIHTWVMSYVVSFILTLFLELPVSNLEKTYLFPRRRDAVNSLSAKNPEAAPLKPKELTEETKKEG